MQKSIDLVSLRDFTEEDIRLKVEWINNPENNQYLHYDIPIEYEKKLRWFHQKDNAHRMDCTIEYDGQPVGVIGLLSIDKVNQKAEYYITVGNTSYQRKGIATKATMLILEYAFLDLDLNKVYLTVDADNEKACGLYERVGMTCEGLFREDLLHHGKLIDRKRYAILKENWNCGWRDEKL